MSVQTTPGTSDDMPEIAELARNRLAADRRLLFQFLRHLMSLESQSFTSRLPYRFGNVTQAIADCSRFDCVGSVYCFQVVNRLKES